MFFWFHFSLKSTLFFWAMDVFSPSSSSVHSSSSYFCNFSCVNLWHRYSIRFHMGFSCFHPTGPVRAEDVGPWASRFKSKPTLRCQPSAGEFQHSVTCVVSKEIYIYDILWYISAYIYIHISMYVCVSTRWCSSACSQSMNHKFTKDIPSINPFVSLVRTKSPNC